MDSRTIPPWANREWVDSLANALQTLLQFDIALTKRQANLELSALTTALVRKGLVTSEEIEEARKEGEAAIAVEEALNPEIQAHLKQINDLMRDLNQEGSDPSDTSER